MSQHVYVTPFQLTNPVIDYEKARSYLLADDMATYLKTHINVNTELGYYDGDDFSDAVEDIRWNLLDLESGETVMVTNRELTPDELKFVSEWVLGQNSDGLGEGFEQQPFASYECDEETDGYGDPDWVMASFDWEKNEYPFEDKTEAYSYLLKDTAIESEQEDTKDSPLELTEEDLDFAQMDLSDFGLY